jgi:hypothetical protein
MAQLEKSLYWPFRQAFNHLYSKDKRHHYFKDPDTNISNRLWYDAFVVRNDWIHVALEYKICHNTTAYCFASIFSNTSGIKEIKLLTRMAGKRIIIIQFTCRKWYIKYYDIDFVNANFDKKFAIEEGGTLLGRKEGYYDVESMIYG